MHTSLPRLVHQPVERRQEAAERLDGGDGVPEVTTEPPPLHFPELQTRKALVHRHRLAPADTPVAVNSVRIEPRGSGARGVVTVVLGDACTDTR